MRKKSLEVYQLALRMAGSGKFKNWKSIRDGLVERGYRRAPELLDSNKIRAILDIHCVDSQKSEKVPGESDPIAQPRDRQVVRIKDGSVHLRSLANGARMQHLGPRLESRSTP